MAPSICHPSRGGQVIGYSHGLTSWSGWLDPGFPVVSVGPWTFFVAALDKVQYDYHPHAAQVHFFFVS